LLADAPPMTNQLDDPGSRRAVAENVVYSYDPGCHPVFQYFSIPSWCVGGANTLDEARSSYRSDLARVLGVGEDGLPAVVEHLETSVTGVWVRTGLGVEHHDRVDGRTFVEMLLLQGRAMDGFWTCIHSATTASGAPSVVIVEPHDTLGFVLDQMTAHDALWIVFPEDQENVGWVAIYGPEAEGVDTILHSFDGVQSRDMTIRTFVQIYVTGNIRQLRLLSHPTSRSTTNGR
jgi:hypothetical protein